MGKQTQSGSSLVEVMVALFVLAIGLLGVLAMQTKSMQFSHSAYSYSQAVYFANSMAEQLAMNEGAVGGYETVPSSAPSSCEDNPCTSAQLAQWGVYQWSTRIAQTLPAGKGEVKTITKNGQNLAQINVSFDDSRSDGREPETAVEGDENDAYDGRKVYTILVGL